MNPIKDLREDNDLTLEELGQMIGATKSTVSKYEREKLSLSPELIDKLCTIFKVSADYLLCRSTDVAKRKPPVKDERRSADAKDGKAQIVLDLMDRLTPENQAKAQDYIDLLLARQEADEGKQ